MFLHDQIAACNSVSIVGLEKNCGKTECLNFVLNQFVNTNHKIAVTSIGVDGEISDSLYGTAKPEIHVQQDTVFVTAEQCFRNSAIKAEILDLSSRTTSLGRLVTARALTRGKVILSGPTDSVWLLQMLQQLKLLQVQTTLIDGAQSRLSHGSPVIAEGILLSTGASVSSDLTRLINHTRFIYQVINLPQVELPEATMQLLLTKEQGLYLLDEDMHVFKSNLSSAFLLHNVVQPFLHQGNVIYTPGAVTDALLNYLRMQTVDDRVNLIIKDFTRLFVKPETLYSFINSGHEITVLLKTKLLGVCVNPVAPNGVVLNSEELCCKLSDAINLPVYDLKKQDSYAKI